MRTLSICLVVVVACTALACSTKYGPQGAKGGYSDQRLDNNTFQVEFAGNAYTTPAQARWNLLVRCAELTLDAGFDHFVIVDSAGALDHATFSTRDAYASATDHHVEGSGAKKPGSGAPYATAVIKVYRGPRPADNPSAFDAREVLQPPR